MFTIKLLTLIFASLTLLTSASPLFPIDTPRLVTPPSNVKASSSSSTTKPAAQCANPSIRVEWRKMSLADRQAYAKGVLCLASKKTTLGGQGTLLDDFTKIHVSLNPKIHLVAAFLPWHRYYLFLREKALKDCGYKGPTPYWDWTKDADTNTVPTSPIWAANGGFGGNGVFNSRTNTDGAVTNGPFANLTLNIVERSAAGAFGYVPHKLTRHFNDGTNQIGNMMDVYYTSSAITQVNRNTNFGTFAVALEDGPHDAFHDAVGGDMAPSQSPNDPIFFLHHAQVDRLWTKWQEASPANRLADYSGNTVQTSRQNPQGVPLAKLTDQLNYLNYTASVTVASVMNTRSGPFCYEYDA